MSVLPIIYLIFSSLLLILSIYQEIQDEGYLDTKSLLIYVFLCWTPFLQILVLGIVIWHLLRKYNLNFVIYDKYKRR